MTGSTAFFAPLIFTVPLNRLPPHDVIDYVVRINFAVDFLGGLAFFFDPSLCAFSLLDFAADLFFSLRFVGAADFDDQLIIFAGLEEIFYFVFVAFV